MQTNTLLRLARFQPIFLHISLSKLHPRTVYWTLLSTQGKQKNWNRQTELQMSLLMTRKTARVQKYITVRKIKGKSTTKGKYEKYSNLQKFPCPAVIKAARIEVLSFPSTPCNGISLPLISSFKNYILIKFLSGISECNLPSCIKCSYKNRSCILHVFDNSKFN